MCNQCDSLFRPPSRRTLLKIAASTATATALAACGVQQEEHVVLPDPYRLPTNSLGGPLSIAPSKIAPSAPLRQTVTDNAGILPRSSWTAASLQLRKGIPIGAVHRITIHHSGDGKPFLGDSTTEVIRHLQSVQQAHLQRGMVDIAYHFAIDRAGRAWQLRWLGYEGQHVRPSADGTHNNPHNVGVVVLGDFNLQTVAPAQRDRLARLVRLIRDEYELSAAAVYMHGEIVDTDCPGRNLESVIRDERRQRLI